MVPIGGAGTTTAVFRWANWCRRRPTCQESPKVVHDAPRVVGTVARPTRSVLTFHSCAAKPVPKEPFADVLGLPLAKYRQVTPSTSAEHARWIVVAAPAAGALM